MYEQALLEDDYIRTKKMPIATESQALLPEIKLDTQVRQVGGSKLMTGLGTVVKIRGADILVRFENGASWMQREHISVVGA